MVDADAFAEPTGTKPRSWSDRELDDTMNRPGIRIGKLMVFVGFVAIDLAVGRAYLSGSQYFGWRLEQRLAVAPTGVALEITFLRLVISRGRGLVFWAGFVGNGAVAVASVIWAFCDPAVETTTYSSSGIVRTYDAGCLGARLWSSYLELAEEGLDCVGYPYTGGTTSLGDSITALILFLLPQLLIALAGGTVALLILGRWSENRPALLRRTP